MSTAWWVLVCAAAGLLGYGVALLHGTGRSGSSEDLPRGAAYLTLPLTGMAARHLRTGLTPESAAKAVRHLRIVLGTAGLAITSTDRVLAWDATGDHRHPEDRAHRTDRPRLAHPPAEVVLAHVRPVLAGGRAHVVTGGRTTGCGAPGCPMRAAVVVPLTAGGAVVGALAAYDGRADAVLLRVADELGRWVSGQLELAELDSCRRRVAEAEIRALTAQISPHFVYNSLTAIASFVRTDPVRARDLLLDFADFARYALRRARDFTTLADELGCVDRYLLLERARFGDRLRFSVRVAPEVLPVPVPFLCLQPIVENAIKHGMRGSDGGGEVRVVVRDAGPEAHISVEDDGVGMDPEKARAMLGGDGPGHGANGIGLANVDVRLRQIYGQEYGLVVETAPGQGTKVRLRVPKRWHKP